MRQELGQSIVKKWLNAGELISIRTWPHSLRVVVGLIRSQTTLGTGVAHVGGRWQVAGGKWQIETLGHRYGWSWGRRFACLSLIWGLAPITFPFVLCSWPYTHILIFILFFSPHHFLPVLINILPISLQYLDGVRCERFWPTTIKNQEKKMASGGLTCVKYITFFCNLLFAVSWQRVWIINE